MFLRDGREKATEVETQGVFSLTTADVIIPVKRMYTVNTYSWISTVPWESERSEWVSMWMKRTSVTSIAKHSAAEQLSGVSGLGERMKLANAIIPVKSVYTMNTYSWISTVPWGSERSEWASPWMEPASVMSVAKQGTVEPVSRLSGASERTERATKWPIKNTVALSGNSPSATGVETQSFETHLLAVWCYFGYLNIFLAKLLPPKENLARSCFF